jgi:predicted metal-binding membrane protein
MTNTPRAWGLAPAAPGTGTPLGRANLPRAVQFGLIGLLIALSIFAWIITGDRMEGMDAGPGTDLGGLGWFVGVWVVMMAAMMFPSILPMVLMYSRIQKGRRELRAATAPFGTAIFVGGYLVSWTAAGLLGYGLFDAFRSLEIGFLAWDEGGRFVAAGILLVAAVYELTPLKDLCLSECRDSRTFMGHSWRPGAIGAARMGIAHGAWCIGCCWALMAALFALGVMSLAWMALIAAMIATEKLLPWKAVATRAVMAVLLALAIAVAVAPDHVPGLTVPGSHEPMGAMGAMGTEASWPPGAQATL